MPIPDRPAHCPGPTSAPDNPSPSRGRGWPKFHSSDSGGPPSPRRKSPKMSWWELKKGGFNAEKKRKKKLAPPHTPPPKLAAPAALSRGFDGGPLPDKKMST